jgi:hypothetical protein
MCNVRRIVDGCSQTDEADWECLCGVEEEREDEFIRLIQEFKISGTGGLPVLTPRESIVGYQRKLDRIDVETT